MHITTFIQEQQLLGLLMLVNSNMTPEQVKATLSQYAPPPAEELGAKSDEDPDVE